MPKSLIPKKNSPDRDKFYTPQDLADKIIDHFKPSGYCVDPCSGKGAFYESMKRYSENVDCYELDAGDDFLDDIPFTSYDWSISNWPWSKFRAFLKKNMYCANNIVSLCTINHIFGLRARLRDIKEAGFFIRECLLCETPKNFPQSGFQLGAVYLSKESGDCKFSELKT